MSQEDLTIFDIAEHEAFAPLRLGMAVAELASLIGPPDSEKDNPASPRRALIFGDVSVEQDEEGRIIAIELKVTPARRAPFYRRLDGARTFIALPPRENRGEEAISRELHWRKIPNESRFEDKTRRLNAGQHVSFLYERHTGLRWIRIAAHDPSRNSGFIWKLWPDLHDSGNLNYYRRSFDLLDICRDESFGPIHIGTRLEDLGNYLGPPESWRFAEEIGMFYVDLRYGEVEFFVEVRDSLPIVCMAQIELMHLWQRSKKRVFELCGPPHRTVIRLPRIAARTAPLIRAMLESNNIAYESRFQDDTEGVPNEEFHIGKTLTLYFNAVGELAVIILRE
jgi:hypothetical protein